MSEQVNESVTQQDNEMLSKLQNENQSLKEQVADLTSQVEKVVSKNNELLSEKKNAQAKAQQEHEESLRSKGDFESLLQDKQQKYEELQQSYNDLINQNKSAKVNTLVTEIAGEVFKNPIMSKIISDSFAYSDDMGKVIMRKADGSAVATKQEMIEAIKAMPELKDFVIATNSNGGGATGGSANPTYDLSKMSASEQTRLANEKPEIYRSLINK